MLEAGEIVVVVVVVAVVVVGFVMVITTLLLLLLVLLWCLACSQTYRDRPSSVFELLQTRSLQQKSTADPLLALSSFFFLGRFGLLLFVSFSSFLTHSHKIQVSVKTKMAE